MLKMSAGGLLAAGLWPGALKAAEGTGDFHFIAVNDLHLRNRDCVPNLENVIKQFKGESEKIEFCLVVGDLSEDGTREQLVPAREILAGLGKPVYVVVGNHDHLENGRRPYEDTFPKSINYRFDHEGWQFVGLDTSQGQRARVTVQPATLKWLDETVAKLDKKRPTVVFTHFPLGPWVVYRAINADAVLERFKEHNLVAVFNGHFHSLTKVKVGKTILTTNRCCSHWKNNHDGSKEKGYFLCQAKEGKIDRKFVEARF
jgi:3',5'-cyclic AMP phosphodiesterase CpdA